MSRAQHGTVRSLVTCVCCLGVLSISHAVLFAQVPRLEPGARIRLEVPSAGGRLEGTLVALESDTVLVREDGQAPGLILIVLADSIARVEVRRERPMTLEGAGVGLLAGTLLALTATPDLVDENGDCTTLPCLAYKVSPHLDTRMAVLGVVGTLLGAIAGAGMKTQTWEPVQLNWLDVGPAPDGGLALGIRIHF